MDHRGQVAQGAEGWLKINYSVSDTIHLKQILANWLVSRIISLAEIDTKARTKSMLISERIHYIFRIFQWINELNQMFIRCSNEVLDVIWAS